MPAGHNARGRRHDGSDVAFDDIHSNHTCAAGISDDMDDKVAGGTSRSFLYDVRFPSGDMADRSGDDIYRLQNGTMEKQGDNLTGGIRYGI